MRASRQLVVWQAPVPWSGVAGTDRQLVSSLGELIDVLWVDPPLSVAHLRRTGDLRSPLGTVSSVAHGVLQLVVSAPPFPERRGVAPTTRWLVESAVRRAVRKSGRSPLALVSTTPQHRLGFLDGARNVYYATDDFRSGAGLMGVPADRMARLEERRVAEADLVGAVSPAIMAEWGTGAKPRFVLPNGCAPDRYAKVDEAPDLPELRLSAPVAGVVGQFSPRIDLGILEAVAECGTSLLLVGPRISGWGGSRFDALVQRPEVCWVGQQPVDALPSYLRLIDVGMTPYVDSPFNRASFPLKTLEYLAAGRAAVSTPLPAVETLGTDLIVTAATPEDFAAAVVALAARQRSADDVRHRRAFAERHSWTVRATMFLDQLRLTSG